MQWNQEIQKPAELMCCGEKSWQWHESEAAVRGEQQQWGKKKSDGKDKAGARKLQRRKVSFVFPRKKGNGAEEKRKKSR